MLQLVRELVFKLAVPDARPARAVSERVARLDHKLGDHAVEEHAVVVPAPRMADEVLHRLGRLLREKPHVHVAQRRVDRSGRRERRRTRRSGRRGGGDRLFLARRALVEYVSVAGFRTDVSEIKKTGEKVEGSKVSTGRKKKRGGDG
jgi:hypothetical protein